MTGIVVKRSKNETPCAKSGRSLGFCVLPTHIACIAIPEHSTTNSTASRIDIAEACRKESAGASCNKLSYLIVIMFSKFRQFVLFMFAQITCLRANQKKISPAARH